MNNNSVHLQNFPDVSYLDDEKELIANMDLVRAICSLALFIRDQKNLRVRIPLSRLIVIGKESAKIKDFADIIAEEVNVKKIEFQDDFAKIAQLKLQINFKKTGAKFGNKIKEITQKAKDDQWLKISPNQVQIDLGSEKIILSGDDFEIKLTTKNDSDKNSTLISAALPSNDGLIQLDTKITDELKKEGVARDIVRIIQEQRKLADFDISDNIDLEISAANPEIISVLELFENYIKEQTLTKSLKIISQNQKHQNERDDGDLNFAMHETAEKLKLKITLFYSTEPV